MSESRPIRLPAADFNGRLLPTVVLKNWNGLRVHSIPRRAVQFRLIPSHRFSHPDASEGLIYLAEDLETCLWESFGDAILNPGSLIPRSQWMNKRVSEIQIKENLKVVDLTETKTRSALKVDLSALKHTDLEVPQAWGLAIQNHPAQVDGFYYNSRFTNERCLVLFDRKGMSSNLKSKKMGDLSDLQAASLFLDENDIALV